MILQAKHLTKRYGDHMAVDDIQLEFEKGSFNAILGPNGAGKSTTISMLIGLKKPTKRSDSICAKYENRSCFSS